MFALRSSYTNHATFTFPKIFSCTCIATFLILPVAFCALKYATLIKSTSKRNKIMQKYMPYKLSDGIFCIPSKKAKLYTSESHSRNLFSSTRWSRQIKTIKYGCLFSRGQIYAKCPYSKSFWTTLYRVLVSLVS